MTRTVSGRARGISRAGVMLCCLTGATLVLVSRPAASADGDKLDICAYAPAFDEDFNRLSVSRSNAETARWTAHTPWNGDFGDAGFIDPTDDQAEGHWSGPFMVRNGVLTIEARKHDNGKWTSGLLASTDPTTAGYAQTYGYFETRMKLPDGPGVWPAFWLATNKKKDDGPSVEIDVLEYYGKAPGSFESTVHVWNKGPKREHAFQQVTTRVPEGTLSSDFHRYGVDVAPDWTTFYLDRREVGRLPTPPEHDRPLTILLNLALGSGWPIDQTKNPSHLLVDYVRAYTKLKAGPAKECTDR